MIEFLKRNAPPGIDLKQECQVWLAGNIVSVIISFFAFLIQYVEAREQLFTYEAGTRERIEGAIITPFYNLFGIGFSGFFVVSAVMLCFIIYHYAYYRQGSMSIYLMKRLPRKRELHIRALAVPCLAVLATLAVAFAAIALYFIIYILATPKECLPYAALRVLWR